VINMKCSKVKILISVSLDGELSRRDQLALDRHLASCVECAQEKSEFAGLRDVMSCWPDEEPSEWLAANFSQKLEQFQHERLVMKPGRPRWVFGMVATGAAAALIMVGFMLHMMINKPLSQHSPNTPPMVAKHNTEANPISKQVDGTRIANNPVKVVKPEPVVKKNPVVAKNVVPRIFVHKPAQRYRYTRVASADIGDTSYSVRPPGLHDNLASRKGMNTGINTDEMRLAMSVASERAPVSKVKDNLNEAGVVMNESVERVRGTLQRAVDLAVSGTPSAGKSELNNNGGSTL